MNWIGPWAWNIIGSPSYNSWLPPLPWLTVLFPLLSSLRNWRLSSTRCYNLCAMSPSIRVPKPNSNKPTDPIQNNWWALAVKISWQGLSGSYCTNFSVSRLGRNTMSPLKLPVRGHRRPQHMRSLKDPPAWCAFFRSTRLIPVCNIPCKVHP